MAKQLSRQELYGLVWSTPMKTLAAQFGISDVGLKKTCFRASIPTSDRGYWAKVEAGKKTIQVALPKRAPSMRDTVVVAGGGDYWYRYSAQEELQQPLPAPPEFPEPIDAVRERIVAVIGEVTVPQKVKHWYQAIDDILKEDDRRREQQRVAIYRTSWDCPRFDSPLERRRLRILNSLFFAAAKMNGKATTSTSRSRWNTRYPAVVGLRTRNNSMQTSQSCPCRFPVASIPASPLPPGRIMRAPSLKVS
jgi:hypothetical protein